MAQFEPRFHNDFKDPHFFLKLFFAFIDSSQIISNDEKN